MPPSLTIDQSRATGEAVLKIGEIIEELAAQYEILLPGNPRREEIARKISRFRLVLASLNKTNA